MKVIGPDGELIEESPSEFFSTSEEDEVEDNGPGRPSDAGTVPPEGEEEEVVSWPIAACRMYCDKGNMAYVARHFGKTVYELNKLARTVLWQDEAIRYRKENAHALDATYTRVLDRALVELEDRIIQGEVVGVNKDGSKRRMPVTASVLTRVADSVFMKRQLLRNEPTAIAGDTDKMNILAQKLRALGAKDPTMIEMADEVPRDEQNRG
jgi:hypothetical protein